jgi:hypothetical protein
MEKRTLVIANSFHGTAARVRSGQLSARTVRRVREALCGAQDCVCGGVLGQRGSQLQPDGLRDAMIEDNGDGTAQALWVNRDGNR